jgi:hypothetical protein
MFGLSWFKLGGGLAAIIAFGALMYFANDRFDQKEKADAARSCNAVAFKTSGDLSDCLPEVKSAIEAYRAAETCDAALSSPLPATSRFAIRQACSTEVKTVVAARDAARNNERDARQALAEIQANTVAAVTRAEQRGAQNQKRISNASKAIEAAPRRDDGLVECDADCLRDIGG